MGIPHGHRRHFPRGAVMVYSIVVMIALLSFAALAIDLGHLQLAKSELQTATDAAARYGVTGLTIDVATVKARVTSTAAANTVDGTPLIIDPEADIEFGVWDSTTKTFTVLTGSAQSSAKAIRVTGRRLISRGTGIPLSFGSLFSKKLCDLQTSCIVNGGPMTDDVFLVQDVTGSFFFQLPQARV